MALEEIRNFLKLDERLWTGGQPSEAQLRDAAAAGAQVVINLALSTSDNALPDENATVTALGMDYIHIPVVWDSPKPEDLLRFLDAMDAQAGKTVLAHCAANYRATAFTALWRVLRQGWDVDAAFAPQRQTWNLAEYPAWDAFVREALAGKI